jgi:hypothetical protein
LKFIIKTTRKTNRISIRISRITLNESNIIEISMPGLDLGSISSDNDKFISKANEARNVVIIIAENLINMIPLFFIGVSSFKIVVLTKRISKVK